MLNFLKSFLVALTLPLASFSEEKAIQPEPIVILGGGVGSMTSALYLGRAGFSPLVIEGPNPGGLLTQSHTVQNWPGEMDIDGTELTDRMKAQAVSNGARFSREEVVEVDFSQHPFVITTRSLDAPAATRRILAESCIVGMGTKPNFLGVPGEQTYWGRGVTNCATCDGSLYKGKIVGVVGGGDAAVLEALYLSNIAKEVHVFVRKDSLKAIEEKRVAALKEKKNVIFHYGSSVEEVKGDGQSVTGVVLKTNSKKTAFPLDGLFLAIGSTPNTLLFKKSLELDQRGYILLKQDQETSVKGVYAIGDIVDPVYKQAISAAGDGAKAALQTQEYLSEKINLASIQQAAESDKAAHLQNEVIDISSVEQFEDELASSAIPVVVDFYATWCGPCKRVAPAIEFSANQLAGKVKFLKVNVDLFDSLSSSYNVKAMPTVVLLNSEGQELQRKVGPDQIAELLKQLAEQAL